MNPDELKQQLAELKTQLEAAADAKTKAAIEAEMKKIQAAIDSTKDIPTLRTELDEAKAKIVVLEDNATKNQKALDDLIAGKGQPIKVSTKSFNEALREGIEEHKDAIQTIVKERKVMNKFTFDLKAVGGAHLLNAFAQLGLAVEEIGRDVGFAGDAGETDGRSAG